MNIIYRDRANITNLIVLENNRIYVQMPICRPHLKSAMTEMIIFWAQKYAYTVPEVFISSFITFFFHLIFLRIFFLFHIVMLALGNVPGNKSLLRTYST